MNDTIHINPNDCTEANAMKTTLCDAVQDPDRDCFIENLVSVFEQLCQKLLCSRPEGRQHLTYEDAICISDGIRSIFRDRIGQVPGEIQAALHLGEAVLSPSKLKRVQLVRTALVAAGGGVGLMILLQAMASALGWGLGVFMALKAWLFGSSMAGPISWGVTGAVLVGIAGYLSFTDDMTCATERYRNALKAALRESVHRIWDRHGKELALDDNH